MRTERLRQKLIDLTPKSEDARAKVLKFIDNWSNKEITSEFSLNFNMSMSIASEMARPSMTRRILRVNGEDPPPTDESDELDACVAWVSENWNSSLEQMEDACLVED